MADLPAGERAGSGCGALDLAAARAQIRSLVGAAALAALHRRSVALDRATLVAVPLLSIALVLLSGTSANPVVIALAVLGQGYVLQWFGLINHEFFVHRRVGGPKLSRPLALLFTVPIFLSFTRYGDAHKAHHAFIGTNRDAEGYKQDIDTRLKRILFCTYFGISRAASGKMGAGRDPYFRLREPTRKAVRHARQESIAFILFAACVLALGIRYPAAVFLGYLVPLAMVLPALNALRILYEHAELERGNPYFIASRFRCGPLEELAFLWDAGEFHLIHHYFPNIPFYRMRQARRTLDPFFDARGIPKTTGRLRLLRAWFIEGQAHGAWWMPSEDGTASRPA